MVDLSSNSLDQSTRTDRLVAVLVEAFSELMAADPGAFQTKFRKMAADPFAFYRGSACVFYADVAQQPDPWVDERTSRVWIHGDLHAENFGVYMNDQGMLVFDVNDFDEAYLGHYTWDVKRFCASLALLGWQKALSDEAITRLIRGYAEAYIAQVRHYVDAVNDYEFALRLDTAQGPIHQVLLDARSRSRLALLGRLCTVDGVERRFKRGGAGTYELDEKERAEVMAALDRYVETIPKGKRQTTDLFYRVKDLVRRTGFGIGSAGLPAYNVLLEGYSQALENDVVLSMKQANVPAVSRVVHEPKIRDYFIHEGHRTAVSQRALQAHADPLLGYTEVYGVGFLAHELSPYEVDLDWSDLVEFDDIRQVVRDLGRATAKMHCVSDADSAQSLVTFQTEQAISEVVGSRTEEFVDDLVTFAHQYAAVVRDDHRLFVDAFRSGKIPGIPVT
ncbi:MAG: DUF2252 domain-containing protein [Micromonosporaceae bacterium]